MAWFGQPKRTVPKPEVMMAHQSANPMFPSQAQPELRRFRRQVLGIAAVAIVSVLFGLAVYGPWLRINRLEVRGTRLLSQKSVERVTNDYLDGRRFLILPRRNLWLLSSRQLGQFLLQRINRRLSIEAVVVAKLYPHQLVVTIVERTPVLLWSNGQQYGSLDRQGILIERRATPDTQLDLVRDELGSQFSPDQRMLQPEVVAAILDLQDQLRRARRAVKEFIIPLPSCPLPPRSEALSPTNANENSNTDQPTLRPFGQRNTNQTASTEAPPCDVLALRLSSQEIHVRLVDGPLVLFDRHQDLGLAVTTLQRLLTQPENRSAQYIDIRFQERVFIR